MSDFITIKITETVIKRLKFSNETDLLKRLKSVSTISAYIQFLEYLQGEIIQTINDVEKSLISSKRNARSDKRENKVNKIIGGKNRDIKLMKIVIDL